MTKALLRNAIGTLTCGTLCLATFCGCAVRHTTMQPESAAAKPPTGQIELVGGVEWPAFPARWCGTWGGTCRIVKDNDIKMTFYMELAIAPIARTDGTMPPGAASDSSSPKPGDTYTWTIVYAKDAADTQPTSTTRQVRPYKLIVNDYDKGSFTVDEGGGLLLPLHDMGGPLYCTFEVGGRTLVARYGPDLLGPIPSINVEILTFDGSSFAAIGPAESKVRSGSPSTLQAGVLTPKH